MTHPADLSALFKKQTDETPIQLLTSVQGGRERASGILSWVSAINEKLIELDGAPVKVKINQGGKRTLAVGAELPLLRDELDRVLRAQGRQLTSRVSFSIGFSFYEGDYEIGERTDGGLYMGVRVQKRNPEGTIDQELHEGIFNACLGPLEAVGLEEWQVRKSSEGNANYWSIWRRSVVGPESEGDAAEIKDLIINRYLAGLGALRGLCW